jgi:hypothetical protein
MQWLNRFWTALKAELAVATEGIRTPERNQQRKDAVRKLQRDIDEQTARRAHERAKAERRPVDMFPDTTYLWASDSSSDCDSSGGDGGDGGGGDCE